MASIGFQESHNRGNIEIIYNGQMVKEGYYINYLKLFLFVKIYFNHLKKYKLPIMGLFALL